MAETKSIPNVNAKSGADSRLYSAIDRAYDALRPYRERRADAVKKIAGDVAKDGGGGKIQINEMRFANEIYTRLLAPRSPQGLLSTRSGPLKIAAAKLQLATNQAALQMDLASVVEIAVTQALTSLGMTKTGITYSKRFVERMYGYKGSGVPYSCNVDFDDCVYDIFARKREDMEFVGNYHRQRREDVESDDSYDQSVVKKLTGPSQGDEERVGEISRGKESIETGYYDYIDLLDLFLPHTCEIMTVSADFSGSLEPLRREKYAGPDYITGPYDMLWFYEIDGQISPLPPADFWKDMHDLINEMSLKLGDQAMSQKKIALADARNPDDAEKIRKAKDGEFLSVLNGQNTVQQSYGGVDNNTLGFMTYCMSLFNKMNWNLEVLAGVGPQSNTLGQDEMISASANKQVSDMQERVFKFVASILRKVAWCILTDPMAHIEIDIPMPDGGSDREIYDHRVQRGKIFDYNVELHPYSNAFKTPAARLNAMNQFMQTVAIPLYQQMAQQGVMIDWKTFIDLWSQYAQLPEIKDVLKYGQPQLPPDETIHKPPTSTRNYVRKNVKDTSPDAERMQMMQTLMSSKGGQAE